MNKKMIKQVLTKSCLAIALTATISCGTGNKVYNKDNDVNARNLTELPFSLMQLCNII